MKMSKYANILFMINVLMIGPSRKVHGGISAVVNNLFDAGLDKQVNLRYLATMEEGNKLHKLMVAIKAYITFSKQLEWADIVHVNMASDSSYKRKSIFIKKAHVAGKRIIIHQHGGDFEGYYSSLTERQKEKVKTILNMGDDFLVLSPAYKDFFEKHIEIGNIQILPDSIEIEPEIEKDFSVHNILFLGRICEAKGIKELIQAVKKLSVKYSDIHLYIGGIYDGKESSIKELIESEFEHVTHIGWLEGSEKSKWLKKCPYFALPSYFEGQSVAILEAMSHSCAIVASNIGGIPMMIADGQNGVLVQPRNVDSLIEGFSKLFDDSSLSRLYAKEAYKIVKNEFSIDNTIDVLTAIYKKGIQ